MNIIKQIKEPKPSLPRDFTIQKPQYPPLAKDFTTERPFTVTPSEVSKVEQFKQFKAQNPASAIRVEEPQVSMPTVRTTSESAGLDSVQTEAKKKFRKTLTNSFQKSQLDDEAKLYFDANPREYDEYANIDSWEKAFDKVSSNVDDYKKTFDSKTSLESADDTAEGIALMNRLSASKDIDGLYDVADKFAERATRGGQAIQAIVMLQKTTPEGKLVQGFNAMRNARKKIEEE